MEHHSILLVSVLTTHQLSEPYSRTDFTLLSKRSRFVLRLYCFDLQMGQSWGKAPLAFPSIALMYFDSPLTDETAQRGEIFHKLKWFLINKEECCGHGVDRHHLCLGSVTEPNLSGKVVQPISFTLYIVLVS